MGAVFDRVDRPVMGIVARGGVGEVDLAVGCDVEVVGIAQPGVVDDGGVGAVRFRPRAASPRPAGEIEIEAHGADAGEDVAVPVDGKAQGKAAGVGEDLGAFVVGREEADDLAVARATIEMVVAVQHHVLRAFEFAEADVFGVGDPVVERIGRWRCPARADCVSPMR